MMAGEHFPGVHGTPPPCAPPPIPTAPPDASIHTSTSASVSGTRSSSSSPSVGGPDESFHSQYHAYNSLRRMDAFCHQRTLTDVTLVAGSRRIQAHRLVLAAATDYFAAMFGGDMREAGQGEVTLHGVDPDALATLVRYCYTGSLELWEEMVENLLVAARVLQLTEVVEAACGFLMRQLHPSNCLGILGFAETQGCPDLLRVAHYFVMNHFMEVIENQEFMMLPADDLSRLLASDDLNVPSEEVVFQALMSWLQHDLPNRKQDIGKLLRFVRLPLVAPEFIVDRIESNSHLREDRECQELIVEALKYQVLPERRSSLQNSRTRPRKSTVGSLYAVGGMDANKGAFNIEQYDYRLNTWSIVGMMAGRRLQFGVAVVEDKLFVVGGRDGLKTLNTVECYDPGSQVWTPVQPMSTHRHGLGVAVLEGPLYAVGGHDGWSYLSTVERWDPETRQWTYVAPMSTQRSTVGVAILNGKLYAVGGRDGSSCLRTVEVYDPHRNKWTMCAPMLKRRGGVGVGSVNGFLYAIGGHDAPASNPCASRFDCVERYDPKTDTWTQVASMSVGRDAVGVAVLGDKLFAVGGYDGQQYLNIVECYDPLTNEWTKVGSLVTGRAGACLAVMRHQGIT